MDKHKIMYNGKNFFFAQNFHQFSARKNLAVWGPRDLRFLPCKNHFLQSKQKLEKFKSKQKLE